MHQINVYSSSLWAISERFLSQVLVFLSVKLIMPACYRVWLVDKVPSSFSLSVHVVSLAGGFSVSVPSVCLVRGCPTLASAVVNTT